MKLPDILDNYIELNGCLIWKGAVNETRYGMVLFNGKIERVHRIVAHVYLGYDLKDKEKIVMHKCDNPPCMYYDHLIIGTNKDNTLDAKAKGRLNNIDYCRNGHIRTEINTYIGPGDHVRCRICDRFSKWKYKKRKQTELENSRKGKFI